ncbi:hypothetical protein E4U49_006982 [Claviceps purpurea]|nr:hypothetical protein E4U49_006982 [Claviceps purpurea]
MPRNAFHCIDECSNWAYSPFKCPCGRRGRQVDEVDRSEVDRSEVDKFEADKFEADKFEADKFEVAAQIDYSPGSLLSE